MGGKLKTGESGNLKTGVAGLGGLKGVGCGAYNQTLLHAFWKDIYIYVERERDHF